jgi:putative hydrolase of the HAD superfamily
MTAAVIFDLDDTLYPERSFAFSGFAAVAEAFKDAFGDPERAAARMRNLFDTGHRGRVFNQMLAEAGHSEDPDLIRRIVGAYHAHRPSITLYPDADTALKRLRPTYKLGLLTDGPAVMQRAKIDALQLGPRLDAIIITDELGPQFGKPNPRGFEILASQLGLAHAACVYVADNAAKDFVAPNALGWNTVRIVRPEGIYRETTTADGGDPAHVIDSLDRLDEILR